MAVVCGVIAASIFDGVKPAAATRHKKSQFDGIEVIHIDKFMQHILPTCTAVEAFLENRMEGNLVSLITTDEKESKPLFRWNNNFSWTYNGNLAGKSQIKEAVKSKGGNVTGVLRCSMMWAENNGDNSDLDLHCIDASKFQIYFGSRRSAYTNGWLDVDITQPLSQMPSGAVENIAFPDLKGMRDGVYKFFVNQYNSRNSKGFKAEIEFNGEIFNYEFNKPVSGNIAIAEVTLKNGEFSIQHKLPESGVSSKSMWGLDSNEFHKVNLVCLSPNFWGENNVGNKHYFFMLEGCNSDVPLSSFHNEYLTGDLLNHRKVLEVLSQTTKLAPTKKQLAGLGFSHNVQNELILKLSGSHKRVIKVVF